MKVSSHYEFTTTEIDPDILKTPFGVQTNWHVITGAQSCGKTTMIDQLAEKGYQIVPEAGREYFEREMAKGLTTDEILEDKVTLTCCLKDIQLEIAGGLQPNQVTFLDRALPDCVTFYRITTGLNLNDIVAECFHHRYASVFVLDRLPIQQDGLRIEDVELAVFLDEWLVRDYSALGYHVVRVPVLSIEDRLAFILQHLTEQGLI
jgi:predicted ATPase